MFSDRVARPGRRRATATGIAAGLATVLAATAGCGPVTGAAPAGRPAAPVPAALPTMSGPVAGDSASGVPGTVSPVPAPPSAPGSGSSGARPAPASGTRATSRPRSTARPAPVPSPAPAPAPASTSVQQQVLALVNTQRAAAGCRALTADGRLNAAAQGHATDMAVHHYVSHTSQDGRTPWARMRAAGYPGAAMAENIAQGQTTPAEVMADWMASDGHRANILDCGYAALGVGWDARGNYWVQDFAGPA